MNVLIYAPDALAREQICRHLIDLGNYHVLIAETERLAVAIAIYNEIQLTILFDPPHTRSLIVIKDYIREKRRKTRVRILPSSGAQLMEGWRDVIVRALKPVKPRKQSIRRTHPRFQWKPAD